MYLITKIWLNVTIILAENIKTDIVNVIWQTGHKK